MHVKVILTFAIILAYVYISRGKLSLSTCNIECADMLPGTVAPPNSNQATGKPGKRGPKGEKGENGSPCDCSNDMIIDKLIKKLKGKPGSWTNPISSCKQLSESDGDYGNGLNVIKDAKGSMYVTYCDMETSGGGWTLVASIHENFMEGHCTLGDKWSSEHGNNASNPHGDGNWENFATFGSAESATSEDFKSPGYYNLRACDVMISHVPNNTPLSLYQNRSFMRYHTSSCFLTPYGNNLREFYANYYPIRDKTYDVGDNGPAIPIEWDAGNQAVFIQNTVSNARGEVDVGYIQFRTVNHERGSLAICPGVRMKTGKHNAEHVCYGGTSHFTGHLNSHRYCGDFGARDWSGYAVGHTWSANKLMSESVVMIFYK